MSFRKFTVRKTPPRQNNSKLYAAFKRLSKKNCISVKVTNDLEGLTLQNNLTTCLNYKFGPGVASVSKHRVNGKIKKLIITKR